MHRDTELSLRLALSLVALLLLFVPLFLWPVGALAFVAVAVARALLGGDHLGELTVAPPDVRALVDRLSGLADLQPPEVVVLETDFPNAYTATGQTLVVTRGLLRELDGDELAAVVAHELAHVAHRDALVMAIVSYPARMWRGVAGALMRVYLVPFAFAAWVAAVVAALPLMAFSRYRELIADRGSAQLTGKPQALMSALQKLSATRIPSEDLRTVAGLNPFLFMPTGPGKGLELDPFVILPTHPTLEQRLERLARLQRPEAAQVVAATPREPNPRAGIALRLSLLTWPLAYLASSLGDSALVNLAAMATWVGAFVCAVQAIGYAQRGASGGRVAATSLAVLAAPVIVTVVGAVYVA
jgi:heat shock protein HtpX